MDSSFWQVSEDSARNLSRECLSGDVSVPAFTTQASEPL
jgi:hypothetical protein